MVTLRIVQFPPRNQGFPLKMHLSPFCLDSLILIDLNFNNKQSAQKHLKTI